MLQNQYNLDMQQGVTFKLNVNVVDYNNQPVNMTNYTAAMKIRTSYANSIATESLSTSNGEIYIPGSANNGWMTLTLPANRTANVYVNLSGPGNPPKTQYVYDLTLTSNTNISYKVLYGNITFYGQVTR